LFVCTGNICRSPMAEVLLRARAERDGRADTLRVESAGTWGMDGQPAAPLAREVMGTRGLALDDHIARTVDADMLADASVIIVMTRSHRDALAAEFPGVRSKLHLMSELAGLEYDISDPYGGPVEGYETCAANLDKLLASGYERLFDWLEAGPDPAARAPSNPKHP
jgi:protein-tyrosine phosphatase